MAAGLMRAPTRLLVGLAALVAGAALTACGTARAQAPADTRARAAGPAASAAHNATDVMFLQMMIAHNGQGRQLARLATERAVREEVRLLAAAVDATQADETAVMESWLRGWQEPTAVDPEASAHAHHGGLPATGEEQIAALRETTGEEFETMFLTLLTGHQHGAVELARRVAERGENPETKDLAERITRSRTEQIAQLLRLMNG